MKTADQLLHDYAELGSEAAFADLVGRYLDLVHSVALRRVHGDLHLARDIAQTVFADLARQAVARRAPNVADEGHLAAWLHRHTCFVASNVRRAEQRRQTRERLATTMDAPEPSPDAAWPQLAPVLDEAIQELGPADRHAILLRFYERLDFRAVGAALGISDDTAQKRVSRALERLRSLLVTRGVTLSVPLLAGLLAERAIVAAPPDWGTALAPAASHLARTQPQALVPATTGLLSWLASLPFKGFLAAGVVTVATVATLTWFRTSDSDVPSSTPAPNAILGRPGTAPDTAQPPQARVTPDTEAFATSAASSPTAPASDSHLRLTLLAADTGLPIPNAPVEYRGWRESRFQGRSLTGDEHGECLVEVDPGTTWLQLTTRIEGFADTRLEWRPDRGIAIPSAWTLRLERAVPIGGTVIDADGLPVAGAKVGFYHESDLTRRPGPENHEFSWIEVETDAAGRWRIQRIAGSMLRHLYGSASHPDHVGSPMIFVNRIADAETRLRDSSWVFQLGRAVTVTGIVVDRDDRPVPGASVRVGRVSESGSRETTADRDGAFAIPGCRPGGNFVTATAEGFAPTTLETELAPDAPPVRLVLDRGRPLRIRVVDQAGNPVPGANVWLDIFNHGARHTAPGQTPPPPPIQVQFNPLTDALGGVVWWDAPDREMQFDFHKRGHMRVSSVPLRPAEEEHVVVLPPALVVSGTVTDATSGQPVPGFRMTVGWPDTSGSPRWSTLDRFLLDFEGGTFRHAMEEAAIGGMANPGYLFKFEADDYAPFVSRHVAHDEGDVSLEIRLEPAATVQVTVLGPDQRPVPDADVGQVTEGAQLKLLPGRLDRRFTTHLATDAQGQFRWSPDPEVLRVLVVHPVGFAMVQPADLSRDPTVRLQPWARIEGLVWQGGQPASNALFTLSFPDLPLQAADFDFEGFRPSSDAEGRFTFPLAPPVPLQLIQLLETSHAPGRTSWGHKPRGRLDLKPGETHRVELGLNDRLVRLGLRLPPGMDGILHFAVLATATPIPPAAIRQDPDALQRWARQPDIRAALAGAVHIPLAPTSDRRWESGEVPPGSYHVQAGLLPAGVQPGPGTIPTMLIAPIIVPEHSDPSLIDLGEILLQPLD
ncbi:MAG: sigma-70 family RNA polymerase sigma factor [Verrucomicrobiae bacterium]|nr:sigma-70 family RNA polymerase sigma factor [Verrucomicrobiae bacterium]